MNSTEMERNSIVAELEEMLSQAGSSSTSQSDIFKNNEDKAEILSADCIERLKQVGIDSTYLWKELSFPGKSTNLLTFASSTQKESHLATQFDIFLQLIDGFEDIDWLGTEEEDAESDSPRDRVLSLKLTSSPFETVIDHLKMLGAPAHHVLPGVSLVSNLQKVKKKSTRKDRRRERRDRENKDESTSYGGIGWKGKFIRKEKLVDSSVSNDVRQQRERLSIVVAKALAEGTDTALLATILLLLHEIRDWNSETSDSVGLSVGNLFAGFFDAQGGSSQTPSSKGNHAPIPSSVSEAIVTIPNPFEAFLPSLSRRIRSKSITNSELSRHDHDFGSVDEQSSLRDESTSQVGHYGGGMSDAGSTIGSTFADLGTDNTSILGDEMNEEDMLAHAMALSMGEAIPLSTPSAKSGGGGGSESYEAKSTHSEGGDDLAGHIANVKEILEHNVQHNLPEVDPLCAIAPFALKDFWNTLYGGLEKQGSQSLHKRIQLNMIPIRHVICALLIILSRSVSHKTGNEIDESTGSHNATATVFSHRVTVSASVETLACLEAILSLVKNSLQYQCEWIKGQRQIEDSSLQNWLFNFHLLFWCLHTVTRISIEMMQLLRTSELSSLFYLNKSIDQSQGLLAVMTHFKTQFIELAQLQQLPSFLLSGGTSPAPYFTSLASAFSAAKVFDRVHYSFLPPGTFLMASTGKFLMDLYYSPWILMDATRRVAIRGLCVGARMLLPDSTPRLEMLEGIFSSGSLTYGRFYSLAEIQQTATEQLKAAVNQSLFLTVNQAITVPEEGYNNFFTHQLCLEVMKSDPFLQLLSAKSEYQPQLLELAHDLSPSKNQVIKSLLSLLLDRLLRLQYTTPFPSAMEKASSSKMTHHCAGELLLLQSLQNRLYDCATAEQEYFVSFRAAGAAPTPIHLEFTALKAHPSLVLAENQQVAHHVGPKIWATLVTSQSFSPNTGIYEIMVRIDRCSKGHIFVGLATSDFSSDKDAYVGVDRCSWGLIGTRSLWHNKAKVVSDYGTGFSSGSILVLVYDSSRGTLVYKIVGPNEHNDWGVAFENLPKNQRMFLACSLHEKGDKVTILSCHRRLQAAISTHTGEKNSSEAVPSDSELFEESGDEDSDREEPQGDSRKMMTATSASSTPSPFWFDTLMSYGQTLMSHADGLLSEADMSSASESVYALHPVLGVLFPSFLASIFSSSHSPHVHKIPFVSQFLPVLLHFGQRLKGLAMKGSSQLPRSTPGSSSPLPVTSTMPSNNLPLDGLWQLRLISVGSSLQDQIKMQIKTLTTQELLDSSEEHYHLKEYVLLSAEVEKSATAITLVSGVQSWNHVRLFERPDDSYNHSNNSFDLRVSLCGSYLFGRYHDAKSGRVSRVEGSRLFSAESATVAVSGLMGRLATIDLLASSRLASILVGCNNLPPPSSSTAPRSSVNISEKKAMDPAADDAETETSVTEKSSSEGINRSDNKMSRKKDHTKWLSSEIFSGGLRLNGVQQDRLYGFLSRLCCRSVKPVSEDSPTMMKIAEGSLAPSHFFDQVFHEWIHSCLPPVTASEHLKPSHPNNHPQEIFFNNFRYSKGNVQSLDDYLLLHVGNSGILKLGGPVVHFTRKAVLVSLIKQSGLYLACQSIFDDLTKHHRDLSERPPQILCDIWRASLRVLETIVRLKQETGVAYEVVCRTICLRAELLLDILETNNLAQVIHEDLQLLDGHSPRGAAPSSHPTATSVSEPKWAAESWKWKASCSKLINDLVEFFVTPAVQVERLTENLLERNTVAMLRTAGYKSFYRLLTREDDESSKGKRELELPSTSLTSLFSVASLYYLSHAYQIDYSEVGVSTSAVGEEGHTIGGIASTTIQHFAHHLDCANKPLKTSLRTSFEQLYSAITQLLTRSTWGKERGLQASCLSNWHLIIHPMEHYFLHQINLFRVLQTVLDDIRTSLAAVSTFAKAERKSTLSSSLSSSVPMNSNYTLKVLHDQTISRLQGVSRVALSTVYSLAAQIASSGEGAKSGQGNVETESMSMMYGLRKAPSGPDTLSKSLFDLIFAELFTTAKALACHAFPSEMLTSDVEESLHDDNSQSMMMQTVPEDDQDESVSDLGGVPSTVRGETGNVSASLAAGISSSASPATSAEDAQDYVYRILRLLGIVAESKVCAKILTSPKWMSLFLALLGLGTMEIQRRTVRLLQRLLCHHLTPQQFLAFIPDPFTFREMFRLQFPIDDEDVLDLMDSYQQRDEEETSDAVATPSARLLIRYLLQFVGLGIEMADEAMAVFTRKISVAETVSAESLVLLRVLIGIPVWRSFTSSLFVTELMEAAKVGDSADTVLEERCAAQLSFISIVAVLGGAIEKKRVGGFVTIRPFALMGSADNFATKLAAASHATAMLVSMSASTNTVEVVLMDRASRASFNAEREISVTHSLNVAGPLPVRSIRLPYQDVMACADVPFSAMLFSSALLKFLFQYLSDKTVPALLTSLSAGIATAVDEGEAEKSPVVQFQERQLLLHTMLLRAMAGALQYDGNADLLLTLSPKTYLDLMHISLHEAEEYGLSGIESYAEKLMELVTKRRQRFGLEDSVSSGGSGRGSGGGGPGGGGGGNNSNPSSGGGGSLFGLRNDSSRDLSNASGGGNGGGSSGLSRAASLFGRIVRDSAAASGGNNSNSNNNDENGGLRELAAMLSPFGRAIRAQPDVAAQQAALNQMLEIGLPREWCEFALKRTHYNVELAINLCLEHGSEMNQLIAQESMMEAARAQREAAAAAASTTGSTSHQAERRGGVFRRETSSSNSGPREDREEQHSLIRQLLEMGFPPSWCARAMESNQNNLDAALGWILTHDEELLSSANNPDSAEKSDDPAGEGEASTHLSSSEMEEEVLNPLSVISGNCLIKSDLTCHCSPNHAGGFPSIGCRQYPVSRGKWYYEITMLTAGCVQVGWAHTSFVGGSDMGQGVGDDRSSWAFDGWRTYLWHETCAEWGAKWSPGDVIGCAVDMDEQKMWFTMNGFGEEVGMGLAFEQFMDFEMSDDNNLAAEAGGIFPAVSFNKDERIKLNFGAKPFRFPPPEGFVGYHHRVLTPKVYGYDRSYVRDLLHYFPDKTREFLLEEIREIHEQDRDDEEEEANEEHYLVEEEQEQGEEDEEDSDPDQEEDSGDRNERRQRTDTASKARREKRSRPNPRRQRDSQQVEGEDEDAGLFRDFFDEYLFEKTIPSATPSVSPAAMIQKRYFPREDNRQLSADLLRFFGAKTDGPPAPFTLGVAPLSQQLCILYSRLILLRALRRLSKYHELSSQHPSFTVLSFLTSSAADQLFEWLPVDHQFGMLFHFLSLVSVYTARSRVYSFAMMILPPHYSIPSNIGPLFCVGGYPVLTELKLSFQLVFSWLLVRRQYTKIEMTIAEIARHTFLATKREYSGDWVNGTMDNSSVGGGIQMPCIFKEPSTPEEEHCSKPSILLASWLTSILVHCFREAVKALEERDEGQIDPADIDLVRFLQQACTSLMSCWMMPLMSPVLAIKGFAMKMITYLFQELTTYYIHLNTSIVSPPLLSWSQPVMQFGRKRLEAQAFQLLNMERCSAHHASCSDLLQSFLELDASLEHYEMLQLTESSPEREYSHYSLMLEHGVDRDNPYSNWEALSGRSLLDLDGWQTLTGTVHLLPVSLPHQHLSNRFRLLDKQDHPPTLLPGSKVCRQIKAKPSHSSPQKEGGDSGSSSPSPLPSSESLPLLSPKKSLKEALLEKNAAEEEAVSYRIGTVESVVDWPGEGVPGSGRVIRWDDTRETERIRWGAEGEFDVTHCSVKTINGTTRVQTKYPNPPTAWQRLATRFGQEVTFGVILRIRHGLTTTSGSLLAVGGSRECLIEWPDFSAVSVGTMTVVGSGENSAIEIVEEKLVSGPRHSGWESRFGSPFWQSGTKFTFPIHSDSCEDPFNLSLVGRSEFSTTIYTKPFMIRSQVSLQQKHLFTFDDRYRVPNLSLSFDRLSVSKSSSSGQGCAIGSVGFSSGVHYWEFKIEQAELGSVFVGITDKPVETRNMRLSRWQGCGYVNNRTSFRTGQVIATFGERVQVYGDLFTSGDVVGVLLDLNRGRLSFFLDGMKYGEHILSDLGEAFDHLMTANAVHPKTYFPIVGLSKALDRITLTPRWFSTVGSDAKEELILHRRVYQLFSTWNYDREAAAPLAQHLWIYREAWRHYSTWQKGTFLRTKARCQKSSALTFVLDTSVEACVMASIKLGLATPLFVGDRIQFTKSSGRRLDLKEEAVILGCYRGSLWFKLEASSGTGGNQLEGGNIAWYLVPSDVEGFHLSKRAIDSLREPCLSLSKFILPRIPLFAGGVVFVFHDSGAVMRDGIEIDTSDVICTIPANTRVYALEQRVNASNINRFYVYYDGQFGWVSERMRGGSEEVMIRREKDVPIAEVTALRDAIAQAPCDFDQQSFVRDKLAQREVGSLKEAMDVWREMARPFLAALPCHSLSFEEYVALTSTVDGTAPWTVEADMQLAELISKTASQCNLEPYNLSIETLSNSVRGTLTNANSSALYHIAIDRIIARAAILRVANLFFAYTLPFLPLKLPEEMDLQESIGHDCVFEVVPTLSGSTYSSLSALSLPPGKMRRVASKGEGATWGSSTNSDVALEILDLLDQNSGLSGLTAMVSGSGGYHHHQLLERFWNPPCFARRIRSLRRLLFTQTKLSFWETVLQETTTPTPLPQDEYEDPREIKTIRINRIKANINRLATMKNPLDRIKQSVFGQLHKELRAWAAGNFRRSYVGKGHGGQKRAFKVKFVGEGVNDYGGPYRAVFEQIADELRVDGLTTSSTKFLDRCLLPLLLPCPNRVIAAGSNQDKYLLATGANTSPMNQELMAFLGRVVGLAVRHHLNMGLDLSNLIWRPLVRLPLTLAHLETVDSLSYRNLLRVKEVGEQLQLEITEGRNSYSPNYQPEEWCDLTFTAYLADGTRLPLLPGGENLPVTLSNWKDYVRLTEKCRLSESLVMYKAFRDGLMTVLPIELFPLFTSVELEQLICGSGHIDIDLIRKNAEYEDLDPNSLLVQHFWQVLSDMSDEERTLFLRFVWARSRMPSTKDFPMNFKLQKAQGLSSQEQNDQHLPHAQTCFFSLALPSYSSKEVMKEKLLYAIKNSPNMDADVRLHTAEGWGDS